MDIIFFGSSEFAVEPLKRLLQSQEKVICVVTQVDKKKGRGLYLAHTPVKEFAIQNNLRLYQPDNLHSKQVIDFLKDLEPDLFIVVSYGKILPEGLLKVPKIFAINLHASLLPKYRGAAPINWAIINGEKESGVTIIKMNVNIDEGEIISQRKLSINPDDTSVTLTEKLSHLGADLLIETLDLIKKGNYTLIPQDASKMTYAPLLKRSDGLINWSISAEDIYNLIRGSLNWPGAFTHYKDKILKIWDARVDLSFSSPFKPGTVTGILNDGIIVQAGKGSLIIKELQLESGKRMKVSDFLNGHKISIGDKFV